MNKFNFTVQISYIFNVGQTFNAVKNTLTNTADTHLMNIKLIEIKFKVFSLYHISNNKISESFVSSLILRKCVQSTKPQPTYVAMEIKKMQSFHFEKLGLFFVQESTK